MDGLIYISGIQNNFSVNRSLCTRH